MIRNIRKKALVSLASLATAATLIAAPASATDVYTGEATTVVADGLNGPGGLDYEGRNIYVAESGKGQVTAINRRSGEKSVAIADLNHPTAATAFNKRVVAVTGGAEGPEADTAGSSSVYVAKPGGEKELLADLLKYELENNTDGQRQFDPVTNEPIETLSNPFAVIRDRGHGYVLVADAGANAVLRIKKNGHIEPFFVPPVVTTGACEGAPNNDPEHTGCDPVPTGLAYGPEGLYVSTLGALVPGAGRVYVVDPHDGHVKRVIENLDAPTGIAVDDWGNVYVSEVTYGAPVPEGPDAPPPANIDPSTIGRIVKIDTNGNRTTAAVPMPTGLEWHNGALYASTYSIAEQFGLADKGQVVKVSPHAFK